MASETWKVGDLAKQTGLSIRTLHFYEEIGLLHPSGRTEAGHRLYDGTDLLRLQRILSLRQLGFSLDEIRACLDKPEYAAAPLIDLHLARVTDQMTRLQRLHQRLTRLRTRLQTEGAVPASHLLEALEAITMLDNYLTADQIEAVDQLHARDDAAPGRPLQQRWRDLFQALESRLEAGDDPASGTVQRLADEWRALIAESTGGDAALAEAAARLYEEQPAARQRVGMSDAVWAYAKRALAVSADKRT